MKTFWACVAYCALFGCLLAASTQNGAQAQTIFGALNTQERAAFDVEIRATLLEYPEIVAGVSDAEIFMSPPEQSPIAQAYAQAVSDDLALIAAHSARLFDPDQMAFGTNSGTPIALFITRDCPDCTRAQTDLRSLAKRVEIRVTLVDIVERVDMATALGIDRAPSYVLPNMMIRGQMPNIVLERYIKALTKTRPAKLTDLAQ